MSFIISYSVYSNELETYRAFYYGVCLNEIDIHDFSSFLELRAGNNDVVEEAYHSMIWFLWADYYVNPIKKWKCFNQGREGLEKLIAKHTENIELRFLRLTIQENVPDFLEYNSNKKEDKEFVYRKLQDISDTDLRDKIINYLCYRNMTQIK